MNSHNERLVPNPSDVFVLNDSKHVGGRGACRNAYVCQALGNTEVGLTRPPYMWNLRNETKEDREKERERGKTETDAQL